MTTEHITAAIDTREQTPFDVTLMQTISGTLGTGDSRVQGLENLIAVERKSLPDLVAYVGSERERIQRELDRLRGFSVSAVIVEASWQEVERGMAGEDHTESRPGLDYQPF